MTTLRQPTMDRLVRMLAALGVMVAVAACASSPPATSGVGVDASGDWQMTSGAIDGVLLAALDDSPITLTVKGTQIGGRAACNHYGGSIVVENGRPKFALTSMTAMACVEPAMALEVAFTAALPRVVGAARDGDRLTLTGPGVELLFDRLAPIPLAQLVGTDWVLDSMVAGDVVSSVGGDPATLRLDAGGTFEGSTGCRTFSGRWVEASGGITATELGMDQTDCPPDLASQDGHVTSVIEAFRASIEGDRLTLSGFGGNGLIYRVAN